MRGSQKVKGLAFSIGFTLCFNVNYMPHENALPLSWQSAGILHLSMQMILRIECQMEAKCGFFKFCYIITIITYENNVLSRLQLCSYKTKLRGSKSPWNQNGEFLCFNEWRSAIMNDLSIHVFVFYVAVNQYYIIYIKCWSTWNSFPCINVPHLPKINY